MTAHLPHFSFRLQWIVTAMALLPVSAGAAPVSSYKVVARLPHATTNYTEGFFYLNGLFYEGTGLKGQSAVVVTEPETGRVVRQVSLPPQYFGEGIVNRGSDLLEWTWQSHTGFVRSLSSLQPVSSFHYSGEGWGMTRTDKELITSDGTATLRFRDPETFAETRHIDVHDGDRPVEQLNELEYVKGEIYANVWHLDRIARISPRDGHVLSWIDLTGILPDVERLDAEAVLNGIAYDAEHDRLFVTGKEWPTIFEIKVVPKRQDQGLGSKHG